MRFSFACLLAIGCVAGCGSTVMSPGEGESGAATGSGAGAPMCSFTATLETNAGPCASEKMECGSECGACVASATCFDDRCYTPEGPVASFPPPLSRGLYDGAEGETCVVSTTGVLERVEAALWNSGITAIDMDVLLSCDGQSVPAASVSLPASAFPLYVYSSPFSDMITTTFVLDPPIQVMKGQTISILFHAEGSSMYDNSAVSGIYMSDVDPDCAYIAVGDPTEGTDWDYMARLYIH